MSRIHDLNSNVVIKRVVSPVAIGTTGTGKTGKIVDRQGFDGVEFAIGYGTITATNAVFTVLMTEGDVTGTMTSVADADMVPDVSTSGVTPETQAGVAATTPRTSGVSKNVTKKIGYKGIKRYVNLKVSSTVTAGTPISVDAILFNPEVGPTTAAQALAQ